MSIGGIVTLVSYLLLGIILICSFFIGYKRRLVRGAVNFAISVALVIVAYLVTPVISKAVLGISISVDGTSKPLSQLIVDMVSNIGSVKTAIESSSALQAFLESVPMIVVNVVVFFVMYGIMRLLGYIVYKIIDVTCLRKREQKPTYNAKRDKWLGAGFGVVKGLVFTILAFAPLTALAGMLDDVQTQTKPLYTVSAENTGKASTPDSKTLIEENVPVEVTEAVGAYNKSALGWMTKMFGLDNFIFDQLVKFDVAGEKVMLRQDVLNYFTVYNTISEMTKAVSSPEGESFKEVNWAELNKCVDRMFESGLIKGLGTNLVGDLIKNYDKFTNLNLSEYKDLLDTIANSFDNTTVKDYFLNDLKQAYSVVAVAGESGVLDYILLDKKATTENIFNEILVEKNKETVLKMVNSILDMNVVKDGISPALDIVANKVGEGTINLKGSSTEVTDWAKFKTNILNIAGSLVDVNSIISIIDVVNDVYSILKTPEEKIDKSFDCLGRLFDNIDQLEVFRKDNKSVIKQFLEKNGMENLLKVQNEPQITSYIRLLDYLKSPVKDVLKFNLYDVITDETADTTQAVNQIARILADDTKIVNDKVVYSNMLTNVITKFYKVEGFRNSFFTKITDILTNVRFLDLSKLDVYNGTGEGRTLDFEKSYANWEYDINKISQVIIESFNTKIGEGTNQRSVLTALITNHESFQDVVKLIENNKLDNFVVPVLYAKSMKTLVNDMMTLIAKNVNSVTGKTTTLDISSVTTTEGASEDQVGELTQIIKTLVGIMPKEGTIVFPDPNDSTVEANVTYEQVGIVLDAIKLNAFRVELTASSENKKEETGLFNSMFMDLFEYIKTEYPESIALIGTKNPWEIKFTELLKTVQEIQGAKKDVKFFEKLDTVVVGGEVDKGKVGDLIDTAFDYSGITDPTEKAEKIKSDEEKISNILKNAEESDIKVELKNEDKQEIADKIDAQTEISAELKEQLKNFLGITTSIT
jgi:hypothetical protein